MITETITRIKLTASQGMTLTNGEIYGKEIYLADTEKAKNWREITDEEYAEIFAEQEKENNEETNI